MERASIDAMRATTDARKNTETSTSSVVRADVTPSGPQLDRDIEAICHTSHGVLLPSPWKLSVQGRDGSRDFVMYRWLDEPTLTALAGALDGEVRGRSIVSVMPLEGIESRLRDISPPGMNTQAPGLTLTICRMTAPASGVVVDVARECVAAFLNNVGERAADVGFEDLQLYVGVLAGENAFAGGMLADVDRPIDDVIAEPPRSEALQPLVGWRTESGNARYLYDFERIVPRKDFQNASVAQALLEHLELTIGGVDPASARWTQRQYLPTIIRTTKGEPRVVRHSAVQLNGPTVDAGAIPRFIGPRILKALGVESRRPLSDERREELAEYLRSVGLEVPAPGLRVYVSRCPRKQHESRKTYLNHRMDGSLFMFCLGGHDGEGPLSWNEHQLSMLIDRFEP
jgi:hypothetical protein